MPEAAIHIDAATGIEERLEHVPTPRGQLYTWIARPPDSRSCVLICSSALGDFTANYHRERLLGRAVASKGLGAIRFHYAGEGNSAGNRADMSFSSLCADARAIADYGASIGFSRFAALGTRLGSLVAAETVRSMPSAPLVLWEPVFDPVRLIGDAMRAARISRTAMGEAKSLVDWKDELARNGVFDLLGYDVRSRLVDSFKGIDLMSTLGSDPRQVLVAYFQGERTKDPIVDTLIDRGFPVESRSFGFSESWWFQSERVPESGELIEMTTSWLTEVLSEGQ